MSVLNIPEIVADKIDHSSIANGGALSYFRALCHQPIPGPLVGGSAASKDVNKWLDDMIGVYESSLTEFQGGDVQKVLISLLKILCQHYGKLRSPFGSDPSQEVFLFARIHIFVLASLITYSITNLPISKTYSRHHYHDVVLSSLCFI